MAEGILNQRQAKRAKANFRHELHSGGTHEEARTKVREELEDMLGLEEEEARAVTERIEEEILQELGRISNLDVPAIDARAQKRWYSGPSPDDTFWPALESHLLHTKGWTPESVHSIGELSTSVVARLAPPRSRNAFSARGLVVGYVQSGKTANMTAVIAKAMDTGYRMIIILAGLTDALRSQTQKRMEADLVNSHPELWERLTTREDDFDAGTRQGLMRPDRGGVLAVVKKNTHVLARLRDFLEQTSRNTRMQLPALVIDDETDQASPDVSKQNTEEDPSTINLRIREILARLPKVSYVGYTATPFANVLINPAADGNGEYDRDLYPRDFIVSLPAPTEYFGAETLFGRDMLSADDTGANSEGLDVVRAITEDEVERLKAIGNGEAGPEISLPASLDDAILWFILASAVRRSREAAHTTMLLHTSRLTEAHSSFEYAVKTRLQELRKLGTGERRAWLRKVWQHESAALPPEKFGHTCPDEETVIREAEHLMDEDEVVVFQDNYMSGERPALDDDDDPVHAIIIGGDRLARGVTLPGLIVSYFGRNARQYDTLMQMGRWFGYRHGYEDLPRIWMTSATRSNFRELATIEAELREDIAAYGDGEIQPLDWGVRIRKVPGLLVTAGPKMKCATQTALSYSGEHLQTIRFLHRDAEWLSRNWEAGARLLKRALEDPSTSDDDKAQGRVVHNVPVDAIVEFLSQYQTTHQVRTNTKALADYIEKFDDQELARWNVAVVMPSSGEVADKPLGPLIAPRMLNRAALPDAPEDCTDIKALMSRRDILVDVDQPPAGVENNWRAFKQYRAGKQGGQGFPLLLLYPINRDSRPTRDSNRQPLSAVDHVLGMGLVFPEAPGGFTGHYITVDPAKLNGGPEAEDDDE
ncbi:Z1 domain-containing protein [Thioalkalivibrio sp. AKL12]|uniref:Z1 domain-containing protein n=1 Tax=Thioalkalivibrio sp. AKL12 TaxID=1158159 RepID=UPI000375FEBF|nr:Z1 domain-containing protein [Thioalkalivibrio sp. AKL12]